MADTQFVHGIDEFVKNLDKIESKVQRKILRKAGKEAMTPVLEEAKRRVPVRYTGNLKKSLWLKLSTSRGRVHATVSPARPQGAHGHLIELGTRVRRTKKGAYRGKVYPRPFLRPAYDLHKNRALDIFGREVWRGVKAAV